MKSILSSLAVLAATLSSISAQIAIGGECGGPKYQGSNLCEEGAYCALVTDDYQCLKLEDIYAKESISFILTTLPTLTIGTLKPTLTIGTFTLSTPCPTVTHHPSIVDDDDNDNDNDKAVNHIHDLVDVDDHNNNKTVNHIHDDDDDDDNDDNDNDDNDNDDNDKAVNHIHNLDDDDDEHATLPNYGAGLLGYIAGFEFGCDETGTCKAPNLPPLTNVGKADGCGQMKWFYSKGMNTFRLPIGWQYATPTLGGSFDPTMWGNYYSSLVKCCLALPGAYCVIDIHNWARWNGAIIGQSMSDTPYIQLWQMIAAQYASEPRVIFGLMNEPYKLNLSAWAATLQKVVNAIRPIAPRHVILLPGIEYAHADTFLSSGTATALDAIINPDGTKDNLLFDLHQWLDKGNLGTSSICVTDNVAVFTPVVNWLRCNKRKAFLSATGGGNAASDNCMAGPTYMCQQMSYLFYNRDVIVGYTGWAAGSYDASYIYDETPTWPAGVPWVDTPLVSTCMYWP